MDVMASFDVNSILRTVYGVRGLPFPGKPVEDQLIGVDGFDGIQRQANARTIKGTPLRGSNVLGRPVFMPAWLDGLELQNPLITISGEKSIVETDVVNVGTVFEKVFDRPYSITIIVTLINSDDTFPEDQITELVKKWKINDVLTLQCGITDFFLETEKNFILKKIDVLDMQGIENCQVIQLSGSSNIDFKLEIVGENTSITGGRLGRLGLV